MHEFNYAIVLRTLLYLRYQQRWYWVRDRMKQGHFRSVFVPDLRNHADFFTKALPVARHKLLAPCCAFDPDDDIKSSILYHNP